MHFVGVDARNVGAARAAGFGYGRSLCRDEDECWYATTDADSRVDPGWLIHQLELGADMVLGAVRAVKWRHHPPDLAERYTRAYDSDRDGQHDRAHGVDMGFSARAYWRVDGFRTLPSGEDVDLVERIESAGYRIHRDTDLSVITSTRARAPRGFAHYLRQLAAPAVGDLA